MKNLFEPARFQRWLLPVLIILIIGAIIFSALRDNFHVVIADQIYRSAQLSPSTLKMITHLKNIKTIINLRGSNPKQDWYIKEIRAAKQLHVIHYDIPLWSENPPSATQLQELASLILNAPKPILIHCEAGSDRSGLASAMSLILLENAPLSQAKKQFSWHYFVTSPKSVGKQVFAYYQNWLQENHKKNNRDNFIQWIQSAQPFAN